MRFYIIFIFAVTLILSTGCKDPTPPGSGTPNGWWTELSAPTFPKRENAVSFTIGDKAYIGCGKNDTLHYNDFYRYDGTSWTPIASLPGDARTGAVAFVLDGKGYVGLGHSENGIGQQSVYQDFWKYDPSTNTWAQAPVYPGQPRYAAAAFSAGGHGYVGTGINANANRLKDLWKLDLVSESWAQVTDFPDGVRIKAQGTTILDNGFLFGGTDNNDIWEYNHSLDTWSKRLDMTAPSRDGSIIFTIGSDSYYGLGSGGGTYYTDLWKFDFHAYLLTEQREFPGTGRKDAIGFSIGNKGYMLMGGNNSDLVNEFWMFEP